MMGSKWIGWIKTYVESSTVSILVYSSHTKEFKPGRGLGEGDIIPIFNSCRRTR